MIRCFLVFERNFVNFFWNIFNWHFSLGFIQIFFICLFLVVERKWHVFRIILQVLWKLDGNVKMCMKKFLQILRFFWRKGFLVKSLFNNVFWHCEKSRLWVGFWKFQHCGFEWMKIVKRRNDLRLLRVINLRKIFGENSAM